MRFRLIAEEKSHHPVSRLAHVFGVMAGAYHARQKRPASARSRADDPGHVLSSGPNGCTMLMLFFRAHRASGGDRLDTGKPHW
jgi:hypothetical protein